MTFQITVLKSFGFPEFAGKTYTGFTKIEPGEFSDVDYQGFAEGKEVIFTNTEVESVIGED